MAGNSWGKYGGSAGEKTEDDSWCINWSRSPECTHTGVEDAFHLKGKHDYAP